MILEVRDVVRRFGGVRAVDGASLDVEEGSITALIGPNGAGKSTLFNVVSGFLRAEHGTVTFEGKRIDRSPAYRIARGGLVRTFQMPRTLARLSVLDNMLLAAPRPERARELLALVRLESHADDYAGVLSGGQRKLLDFARVLMAEPRLVLLDEPMAGVNPALGRRARAAAATRRWHDLPVRRARHGRRDGGERPRRRDERGSRDRKRDAGGDPRGRARRRRVPRNLGAGMSLEVEDLEAGYGEALVLRGVSLRAAPGELVAIIGPNGAGKSTLLKVVYGLLGARRGAVRYEGEEVTGTRPEQLTRLGLNYVPQLGNVFPSLSIAENLLIGASSLPRPARRSAVDELYERFPALAERRRQRAGTLSGGQRKLLAVARALATRPRTLLLDEPSAGLSPQAVQLVFDKLQEVNAAGIAIVMVEQNARRALALADRGYVLDMGRNAYEGEGRALLNDPKVAELYLGRR